MLEKIGFNRALGLILENVPRTEPEEVPLESLAGRIVAEDVPASVNSPTMDVSLKDGFAVLSADAGQAGPDRPVTLKVVRFQAAGDVPGLGLHSGEAVRVTTGAPLPPGADAVLAEEFTREENGLVVCLRDAGPGRNVLPKGTDVRTGEVIARKGARLHPALIGLLAAAGHERCRVHRRPRVAVIGTGDEIVAPGRPLPKGKLYASNLVETVSWLHAFGLGPAASRVAPDRAEDIGRTIRELDPNADAFITSGGAWTSERDLMIGLLEDMGWRGFFHRVRLGPGKAAGFGLLNGKPFFILPGGPPSHEAAFLLLALPGILAMGGWDHGPFPTAAVQLSEEVSGQANWTQVVHLIVTRENGRLVGHPVKSASRLSSMAAKNALFLLPEGVERAEAGDRVEALILTPQG